MTLHKTTQCARCGLVLGGVGGLDGTLLAADCAHQNPGAAAFEPVREMAARIDAPLRPERRPGKADLLDAAKTAVADRGLNYGTPDDNFARIATLWRAHLQNRYGGEPKVDPHDVAQMMILMKVARLENEPGHLDSWTDVAGYAACGANLPISAR